MNLLNRIVLVILAVALSVIFIVLAIMPEQIVDVIRLLSANATVTPLDRIALVVVAAVVTIIALLLINAEVHTEQRKGVQLTQVSGGQAELSTDSIAQRVKQEVETLPDVVQAAPVVTSRGKSVDVRLTLHTNTNVDVPNKASEVVQATRNVVEQGMGVKLGKLNVTIKYQSQTASTPHKA